MKGETPHFRLNPEKLFALLSPAFSHGGGGSQPNPDEPLKPGPWDPVIRVAGASLHHASRQAYDPAAGRVLGDAADKLPQVGLQRL